MKTNQKIMKNVFIFPAVVLGFILLFRMWHEMQLAEGVGLYLYSLHGNLDRKMLDLAVDFSLVIIVGILLLPCVWMKHFQLRSIFRIFAAGLAFLPGVEPGNLVHFTENLLIFKIREGWIDGSMMEAWMVSTEKLLDLFRLILPLIAILCLLCRKYGIRGAKSLPWIMTASLFCLSAGILCEEIAMEADFAAYYLLLVWGFSVWEKILERDGRLERYGMILFAGCMARGVFRMLVVMSVTQIG